MKSKLLSTLTALGLLGAAGCAGHVHIEDAAMPNSIAGKSFDKLQTPVAQSAGEPSFCLVSILAEGLYEGKNDFVDVDRVSERRMKSGAGGARGVYEEVKRYEPFREFRPLGSDAPDPTGCDLFVKLGVDPYPDGLGTRIERIHVYSAFTQALLWGAWATGDSPILDLARQMHAAFQPGTPEYVKHLKHKEGRGPLDGAGVLAWAGTEMRPMGDYIADYVPPRPKPEPAGASPQGAPAPAWWAK